MKKQYNIFDDSYLDFVPRKQKISKNTKSKQISFLDSDDDYFQSNVKKKKNVLNKNY